LLNDGPLADDDNCNSFVLSGDVAEYDDNSHSDSSDANQHQHVNVSDVNTTYVMMEKPT